MALFTAFICLPGVYETDGLDNCIEIDIEAPTHDEAVQQAEHHVYSLELNVVKMTEY